MPALRAAVPDKVMLFVVYVTEYELSRPVWATAWVAPHTGAILLKKFEGRVMNTELGQMLLAIAMVVAVVKVKTTGTLVLLAMRFSRAMVMATSVTCPLETGASIPQASMS